MRAQPRGTMEAWDPILSVFLDRHPRITGSRVIYAPSDLSGRACAAWRLRRSRQGFMLDLSRLPRARGRFHPLMPSPSLPAAELSPEPQSTYPNLEAFVERTSSDELAVLFTRLKDSLAGLKGPRAEQARKVKVAVERTEELLHRLLELRESLTELRQKPAKKPR